MDCLRLLSDELPDCKGLGILVNDLCKGLGGQGCHKLHYTICVEAVVGFLCPLYQRIMKGGGHPDHDLLPGLWDAFGK